MLSDRSRSLTLAICSALGALVVLAGVAEMGLRRYERYRHTVPGTMPLLHYHALRYGSALVRNADYFGWVHIDREGFRGREVSVAKAPGTTRVMVVGSSTTFDQGVTGDSATWPARLEYWLNQAARGSRFEVINAGVPGYSAAEDLIRLQLELYQYHPDVIVFYEGHNDLIRTLRAGLRSAPWSATPGETAVVTPWVHWLERHSLLYGKVWLRYRSLAVMRWRPAGGSLTGQDLMTRDVVAAGAAQFQHLVDCFAVQAASLGIRLVIPGLVQVAGADPDREENPAAAALWRRWVAYVAPRVVVETYHQYNEVLRSVASRRGAIWIPTDSFGLVGPRWYRSGDPIHFNDAGADRMAKAMAEALLRAPSLHLTAFAGPATPGPQDDRDVLGDSARPPGPGRGSR